MSEALWFCLCMVTTQALAIAIGNRLSSSYLQRNCRVYPWEIRLYEKIFLVRRWKHLLPDGGTWSGGFSKRHLQARDANYILQFVGETRRGEWVHTWALCSAPLYALWSSSWLSYCMAISILLLINIPCIIVQRYNRKRMMILLVKYKKE